MKTLASQGLKGFDFLLHAFLIPQALVLFFFSFPILLVCKTCVHVHVAVWRHACGSTWTCICMRMRKLGASIGCLPWESPTLFSETSSLNRKLRLGWPASKTSGLGSQMGTASGFLCDTWILSLNTEPSLQSLKILFLSQWRWLLILLFLPKVSMQPQFSSLLSPPTCSMTPSMLSRSPPLLPLVWKVCFFFSLRVRRVHYPLGPFKISSPPLVLN